MIFFKNVGVSAIAEIVAGLSAFFYTLLAARMLGVENFGLFQAALGIYGIFSVFILPLNLATVHCIAKSDAANSRAIVGAFIRIALFTSGSIFILLSVTSPWVANLLQTTTVAPIVMAGLLVLIANMLRTFYGGLQGELRYSTFSVAKVLQALMTLAFGVLWIVLGWGPTGAVFGYVCAMSVLCLYFFAERKLDFKSSNFSEIRGELSSVTNILLIFLTLLLIEHAPMIYARIKLSSETSGVFGALYNLRNTIWPFALSITLPFYSQLVSKKNESLLFPKALMLIFLLGLGFIGAGIFLSGWIIQTLYGEAFIAGADYMAIYGASLLFQMITMALMLYLSSFSGFRRIYLLVPTIVLITFLALYGTTILGLVLAQIVACACYFLVSFPLILRSNK